MSWPVVIIASYLIFIVIGIALAGIGKLRPDALAPFSEVVEYIMQHRITRIATFMVWWWLGWHFMVGETIR